MTPVYASRCRALVLAFALCQSEGAPARQVVDRVVATVTDQRGTAISDLTARDFVVQVDGRDVQIFDVRRAVAPLSIVVLTGGLNSDLTLEARRALTVLLADIRTRYPSARIGLMLDEGPAAPPFRDISKDADLLATAINRFVRSGDASPMLESIVVAAQALRQETNERRLVVAFAARQEAQTTISTQQVVNALRDARAALWAIEYWPYLVPADDQHEQVMREVVPASGGRRETVRHGRLEDHAKRVAEWITNQYVVSFERPARPMSARLLVGVRRSGAQVSAPWWLYR